MTDDQPPPIETRTDERGRLIIPAFSLHRMAEPSARSPKGEGFVYWTVNLHDHPIASGEKVVMQFFHTREEAERFIAECKEHRQQ